MDDYQEIVIYGTKAIDNDTDDDGLDDYQEVMVHSTNPLSYDSDSDGISDYDEIVVWFSDPLTFDADNDSDDYYHFQDCDDDDHEVNPGMLEASMERMTIATVLRMRASMIQMRMEMDCRTGKNSTSMEQTRGF